jgi:hypothetical protein
MARTTPTGSISISYRQPLGSELIVSLPGWTRRTIRAPWARPHLRKLRRTQGWRIPIDADWVIEIPTPGSSIGRFLTQRASDGSKPFIEIKVSRPIGSPEPRQGFSTLPIMEVSS